MEHVSYIIRNGRQVQVRKIVQPEKQDFAAPAPKVSTQIEEKKLDVVQKKSFKRK